MGVIGVIQVQQPSRDCVTLNTLTYCTLSCDSCFICMFVTYFLGPVSFKPTPKGAPKRQQEYHHSSMKDTQS